MKISSKIAIMISMALVLYIVSFGLISFVEWKAESFHDLSDSVTGFEESLYLTITLEKEYARIPGKEAAEAVLRQNGKSLHLLDAIKSAVGTETDALNRATEQIRNYQSVFEQLVGNTAEINTRNAAVDEALAEIIAGSDKLGSEIDQITGMAFITSGEIDPSLNSLAISAKEVVARLSGLSLATSRNLLLNNQEDVFLRRMNESSSTLNRELKNISSLVKSRKEDVFRSYSELTGKTVPRVEASIRAIHDLWGKNKGLTAQLDDHRNRIVAASRDIKDSSRRSLEHNRKVGLRVKIASLAGISLILIVGGFIIGRSITNPIRAAIERLGEKADHTATISSQLATGSHHMADGAARQAASLEETSSSLEEMSSMIRQSTENTGSVDRLMKESTLIVQKSNESMLELATSMSEISASSRETQKIIKTIDEIAFQTNLLALNAAVEAARAGETGAGFAVVADEVRNLAGRAAEAARNTALLIENTLKKVRDGSELVTKTKDEFAGMVGSVSRVGELIGEIAAASLEQSQGINQISKAVNDIDKVTQQNAAQAEQSASASEEMMGQVQQMKKFVLELAALVLGKRGDHAEAKGPADYENGAAGTSESRAPKERVSRNVLAFRRLDKSGGLTGSREPNDDRAAAIEGYGRGKSGKEIRPADIIPFGEDF